MGGGSSVTRGQQLNAVNKPLRSLEHRDLEDVRFFYYDFFNWLFNLFVGVKR